MVPKMARSPVPSDVAIVADGPTAGNFAAAGIAVVSPGIEDLVVGRVWFRMVCALL